MTRNILLVLGLGFMLSACQMAPVKMQDVQAGHWKAKALIKDKEQSRSYIVHLNLNAERLSKARMDVVSALGTGVASLVVDSKEVRYILIDSKRYYYGQPQPEVMRPILALPFDPRWLHNILFEIPFSEKSWSCTTSDSWLKECRDSVTGIKITWTSRQGPKRTIFVEHERASVQINTSVFEPKVEDRKNLFILEAPAGYQKLRVR
jgi:hypothetical protein